MGGPGSDAGALFMQTATNATSAVATQAATVGKKIYITDIAGSSDLVGAVILVKDGTTVVWQDRVSNTGAYVMNLTTPIIGSIGNAMSVTVNGTALCNANFAGYVYG